MVDKSQLLANCIEELVPYFDGQDWFVEYARAHQPRYANELTLIEPYLAQDHKIADFAAAPFVLPLALKKAGYDVEAWDIDPSRIKDISDLLPVKQVDLDKFTDPELEAYDVILFLEILEHLRGNLIQTMTGLLESLKPNGRLILSTPNFRSVMGMYKFLFKGIGYAASSDLYHEWSKLENIGHMGHVREYTSRELSQFLERIGFDVEKVIYRPTRIGPGWKNGLFYWLEQLMPPLSSSVMFVLRKK